MKKRDRKTQIDTENQQEGKSVLLSVEENHHINLSESTQTG